MFKQLNSIMLAGFGNTDSSDSFSATISQRIWFLHVCTSSVTIIFWMDVYIIIMKWILLGFISCFFLFCFRLFACTKPFYHYLLIFWFECNHIIGDEQWAHIWTAAFNNNNYNHCVWFHYRQWNENSNRTQVDLLLSFLSKGTKLIDALTEIYRNNNRTCNL